MLHYIFDHQTRIQNHQFSNSVNHQVIFFRILHSNGFSEEEIAERKAVVYSNTVTSMAAILRAMDNILHVPLEDPDREREKLLIFKVVDQSEENQAFTDEVANALMNLWGDKNVRKAYDMRAEYQLNDSAKYFLDSVARIHEPGYRPSEQDILYSRVATTGVVEVKFKIKDLDFRFVTFFSRKITFLG